MQMQGGFIIINYASLYAGMPSPSNDPILTESLDPILTENLEEITIE